MGTPWPGPVALPILMYHHVTDQQAKDALEWGLTITKGQFAQQLSYLRCNGYTSIGLAQLFDAMYSGFPLPERPVIITFDDGYADAYTDAFPLLQEYGFRGTFSVVTGFVGTGPYLTWDQIQAMAAAGMEFVSHSVSHEDLNRSSDAIVREQVFLSKAALEEKLGHPVPFFTYPSGEPFLKGSEERRQQVVSILKEAGYSGALSVTYGLTQDPANPFALSRVRVAPHYDMVKFAENMWGPPPAPAC